MTIDEEDLAMYYEEKEINIAGEGLVLCWRNSPSGIWIRFTPDQLTKKLREIKAKE